jgi:hypothetical protein
MLATGASWSFMHSAVVGAERFSHCTGILLWTLVLCAQRHEGLGTAAPSSIAFFFWLHHMLSC